MTTSDISGGIEAARDAVRALRGLADDAPVPYASLTPEEHDAAMAAFRAYQESA